MPLHPAAESLVKLLDDSGVGFYPDSTPESMRAAMDTATRGMTPHEVHGVEDREIPGPAGSITVRVYRPSADTPLPILVWFHGGGWVIGSLETHDNLCRMLCDDAGVIVVSVDYRLAPETKFPGPVEDAYAAVVWVADHASELGIDPAKIAVGGSSAGGNLAAAAALVARDRGGPRIAFQLLTVPVTELSSRAPSHQEFAEGYGLTTADMEWFGTHYVTSRADADNPYASVLRADLRGLPPAFVITAECDPLRDDGEAYANRLRELGIAASFKRYPGMFHGFLGFPGQLPEAAEAFDDAGAALRAALA
jgi:acetyl esterase